LLAKSRYVFDQPAADEPSDATYRQREVAKQQAELFLVDGLGLTAEEKEQFLRDIEAKNLLYRYASEVILNIAWYVQHLALYQKQQQARTRWTLVACCFFIVLLCIPSFSPNAAGYLRSTLIGAQLTLLATLVLGLVQLVATMTDLRGRISAVWQASSDLKEAFFTFEENWHHKVFSPAPASQNAPAPAIQPSPAAASPNAPASASQVPPAPVSQISPDFISALNQEIRLARKVGRDERTAFFASQKSPSDVVSAATGIIDGLRGRRQELLNAQTALASATAASNAADAQRLSKARDDLANAKATLNARQAKVVALDRMNVAADEKNKAAIALIDAQSEVARCQSYLDMVVKGSTLNPA